MSNQQRMRKRIQKHIDALGNDDLNVGHRAEEHLIRYYGSRAIEQLIAVANDPNPRTRFRVVWILGYTRNPDAYETVLALTQDADGGVRYDAAIALGILGDERAVQPLITLATTPDHDHAVDNAAADGLTRLGQRAIPALVALLDSEIVSTRNLAIWALCRIGDEVTVEKVAGLLETADESTRLYLLDTLSITQAPSLKRFVTPYLDAPSESVRAAAEFCLKSLV